MPGRKGHFPGKDGKTAGVTGGLTGGYCMFQVITYPAASPASLRQTISVTLVYLTKRSDGLSPGKKQFLYAIAKQVGAAKEQQPDDPESDICKEESRWNRTVKTTPVPCVISITSQKG